MRISDWSSDVCSSDLHTRLEAADPPIDTELQQQWLDAQGPSVPELEAWLDEQAPRFDVVAFFTYLYATTTVGLPVAARHTATALVPCAHDEPPLALHAFDRVAHLADSLRSEEHTSELQSLMRISYAVFCLNKKTNTYL